MAPPGGAGGGAAGGLMGRLEGFLGALAEAGVSESIGDGLDARRAVTCIDLLDRGQLRDALAATLCKSPGHRPAFDLLFDLWFPARPGGGPATDITDADQLRDAIVDALDAGDEAHAAELARVAVELFGAVEGRDGRTGYYLYRVLREVNPAGLVRRLAGAVSADTDLEGRLAREELEQRVARFRTEMEAEVRRRTAEARGEEAVARTMVRALPEDVDFFRVSDADADAMRRAVRPLARRLASKLAVKRRRARDGRFDVRRTLRNALATGGVPADPAFRARRPHRPELVIVCDVSGSVASFAKFTLLFCHALSSQFSRVRSFAFVDAIDEVTAIFEEGDPEEAFRRMATEADVVWLDGHSDYGNALRGLAERYADAVSPRSTVLILGDARNNYRATSEAVLAQVARDARRVYWLNPEPKAHWGSGDSVADAYRRHCDEMVECRNLRQLAAFVERIA